MKTIVLATDFTDTATQVAEYALALTGQLDARLVLVHAYGEIGEATPELVSTPTRLEQIREQLSQVSKGKVDVSVFAKQGEPRAVIEAAVAEQQADLLIMALADNRPYTARFMGSLPTEMIPQTVVSMLILPPGSDYESIKTVVLALDLSKPVDDLVLEKAKAFVQQLGATLAIICMDDDPNQQRQEAAQHIRELFDGVPHTVSFLPGNDLTTTLDNYITAHPAELIMMLPQHHNPLAIWLSESVTQQVARQATVPVLAIV